jgi:DNA-binding CsgD family transcriptional regulator
LCRWIPDNSYKEIVMTENTPKPRLVSPSQRLASRPFQATPGDLRFAAMVEEHQRQRQMLTPRELEVLALLCEGLPNKLIERRLGIGAGTVKCHVANILSKLDVASRLQAVIEAHRRGLVNRDADGPGQEDVLAERASLSPTPIGAALEFRSVARSR